MSHVSGTKFRCADLGLVTCNWEATAQSEDELMLKIRQHYREAHNPYFFDPENVYRLRKAFQQIVAA